MFGIASRAAAEFVGTFWLVFGGCGSAVLAAKHIVPEANTPLNIGNPARSTGPALFVGGTPLTQLWLFWLAPIAGATIGAVVYGLISKDESPKPTT